MRFGGTADAFKCIPWSASFAKKFVGVRASNLSFHFCDVVLLVQVLLLFVEVDQILVQRMIEQLEFLQTSADIAVFPEPILPGSDVVQHILDFVVA